VEYLEPILYRNQKHSWLDCFTLRGKIKVNIQWVLVLYGAQYWEDCELWVCMEGMEDGKYIQIGQNICWNRMGSMILVRNPWTRVLIPNVFFKKVGFSAASLS
jgi:hypothetical protein